MFGVGDALQGIAQLVARQPVWLTSTVSPVPEDGMVQPASLRYATKRREARQGKIDNKEMH